MSAIMGADPPKENANPTVRVVDQLSGRTKRGRLDLSELTAFSLEDDACSVQCAERTQSSSRSMRTPGDLAILRALADASEATNGKGVSLLRNIGLRIPEGGPSTLPPWDPASAYGTALAPTAREEERARGTTTELSDATRIGALDRDAVDADEIFDIIRNIQDPEHPLTLEQLGVVSREQIQVQDILDLSPEERGQSAKPFSTLDVRFTPTIPHCSMATQIGLCIRVKLDRSLPSRFKTTVRIEPGTHASENAINKQLADKERVCAAIENKHLLGIVNCCIINGMTGNMS